MSKNDAVIKEFMVKVEAQRSELGDKPRSPLRTNGVFKQPDGSSHLNLNTVRDPVVLVDALSSLLDKVSRRKEAAKLLGIKEPKFEWNGYTVAEYTEDFKNRITLLEWESKKAQLEATEAKLKSLRSEEARTESELEEIAKILK